MTLLDPGFVNQRFIQIGSVRFAMRLANLVPSISAELVALLEEIGIRTESDLLFSATPSEIFSRLRTGVTSLEELESVIDLVTELCAAPGVSALELSGVEAQARAQDKELCSGNDDVDLLLRGLGSRKLVQISGDKGSGKSVRSPRCVG